MACKCKFCTWHKKYRRIMNSTIFTNKADKKFIEDLFTAWVHESENVDYYKSILQGQWPQGKEILQRALKRYK